jgi:toxin ParE1/3/4
MSSPDRQLVLSPRAQDDYAEILQHTLETWGEDQLLVYSKVLSDGFEVILHNPLIGFTRPAVSAQHRFLPVGEHLIAYRVSDLRVEVSRILHQRMDVKRHL